MAERDYGREMAHPSDKTDMTQVRLGPKMGKSAGKVPSSSTPGSGQREPYDGSSGKPGKANSNVGQGSTPYRK